MSEAAPEINVDAFLKVDIRVGKIIRADSFPEARNPSFKLWVDFGPELGTRKTSAQITKHYTLEDLPGHLIAAVVNFPPRQIGKFTSEFLLLGFPDEDGNVVLIAPDQSIPLGGRLY
jgi:tRNA-binding protein